MIYVIALLLFLILCSSQEGKYMVACTVVFCLKAMWWGFWILVAIVAWVWATDNW